MPKRKMTWRLHAGLLERLEQHAETESRSRTSVVEQALAEYLAVPIAMPWTRLTSAVELCAQCERGVLDDGRCAQCHWRRNDRRRSVQTTEPGPAERWRWIEGHEGDYEVSDLGRVRSWFGRGGPSPRVLEQSPVEGGYRRVSLGRARRGVGVHLLVLRAFVGPPPDGMECCHGDGDPANNALANLRWGTHEENEADKARHGRVVRGADHPKARLTEEAVGEIRASTLSDLSLSKRYGVSRAAVWNVRHGRSWA